MNKVERDELEVKQDTILCVMVLLPFPLPPCLVASRASVPAWYPANCAAGLMSGIFPGTVTPKLIQELPSLVSSLLSCGGHVLSADNGDC